MVFDSGNSDWDELAKKYPVTTPFSGSWAEGHCHLGSPSDDNTVGKLGMAGEGFYVEPKSGTALYVPFSQVQKAERLEMGEGAKAICYLTLDGDFKLSLPEDFVKSAGDKLTVIS